MNEKQTIHVLHVSALKTLEEAQKALKNDKEKAENLLTKLHFMLSQMTELTIIGPPSAPVGGEAEKTRYARCSRFGTLVYRTECDYCSVICAHQLPSDAKLPFFDSKPNDPFDSFYCGCHSWN